MSKITTRPRLRYQADREDAIPPGDGLVFILRAKTKLLATPAQNTVSPPRQTGRVPRSSMWL
ncbi:MAG: hypothetical protein WAM44_09215, partial [Chthoniobacterales bacterium]